MAEVTEEQVIEALRGVDDPELERSLVELGMIRDVRVEQGGKVSLTVVLTTPACPLKNRITEDCREAVLAIEGVTHVEVKLDADVKGAAAEAADPIPTVKQLILVMSGKGGVGKSTIAVSIGLALAHTGAKVGLLDADVHGPSLTTLLGSHQPAMSTAEGRILPPEVHGVKFLSMGQFLERENQAIIWRGPMLSTLLRQFLTEVDWGDLDYLIADLPPGTGDAALTMAQTVKVTGAVIVTTPQDVALLDVRKSVDMCREVGIPVLGVVENMSYFLCPDCGARHELFGRGGGASVAKAAGAPLLGQVALDPSIREEGDSGKPTVVSSPESERGKSLTAVAQQLAAHIARNGLGRTSGGPLPPREGPPHHHGHHHEG
jgi:ATP-binding protein involved in chromosome partitioning